jgi:hypothetical protein
VIVNGRENISQLPSWDIGTEENNKNSVSVTALQAEIPTKEQEAGAQISASINRKRNAFWIYRLGARNSSG